MERTDSQSFPGDAAHIIENDLADLKRILLGLPEPDRAIVSTALFVSKQFPMLPLRKKVVVLIHGIRTYGDWQIRFKNIVQSEGIEARTISYQRFKLPSFLLPGPTRKPAIARVTRELRSLRIQYSDPQVYVFCHSFGSYIMSKILDEATDIRIHHLLTCGSIIPRDYRWDKVIDRVTSRTVINEAGTSDIFPVLAAQVTWGYGPSGTFGFGSIHVDDRFFPYGHSDFFSDEHMKGLWMPSIKSSYPSSSPAFTNNQPVFEKKVIRLDYFSWKKIIFILGILVSTFYLVKKYKFYF